MVLDEDAASTEKEEVGSFSSRGHIGILVFNSAAANGEELPPKPSTNGDGSGATETDPLDTSFSNLPITSKREDYQREESESMSYQQQQQQLSKRRVMMEVEELRASDNEWDELHPEQFQQRRSFRESRRRLVAAASPPNSWRRQQQQRQSSERNRRTDDIHPHPQQHQHSYYNSSNNNSNNSHMSFSYNDNDEDFRLTSSLVLPAAPPRDPLAITRQSSGSLRALFRKKQSRASPDDGLLPLPAASSAPSAQAHSEITLPISTSDAHRSHNNDAYSEEEPDEKHHQSLGCVVTFCLMVAFPLAIMAVILILDNKAGNGTELDMEPSSSPTTVNAVDGTSLEPSPTGIFNGGDTGSQTLIEFLDSNKAYSTSLTVFIDSEKYHLDSYNATLFVTKDEDVFSASTDTKFFTRPWSGHLADMCYCNTIIGGVFTAEELMRRGSVTTVNGHTVHFVNNTADGILITEPNLYRIPNGVIHTTDRAIPPDWMGRNITLELQEHHSHWWDLLRSLGLIEEFLADPTSPKTMFVPTLKAMDGIPPSIQNDTDRLIDLVRYHVLPTMNFVTARYEIIGEGEFLEEVGALRMDTALEGERIRAQITDGDGGIYNLQRTAVLNFNTELERADVFLEDGMIQVVPQILLPETWQHTKSQDRQNTLRG